LEEQPLRIQFQNNILSVKAKKQPLVLVLLKIGEELGIPVDIQYEPQDVIDTEISKVSVEGRSKEVVTKHSTLPTGRSTACGAESLALGLS
jgi:hypothetical protein